jgi:hypothetical protein
MVVSVDVDNSFCLPDLLLLCPLPVCVCSTASSVTVRSTIRRLREQVEA